MVNIDLVFYLILWIIPRFNEVCIFILFIILNSNIRLKTLPAAKFVLTICVARN